MNYIDKKSFLLRNQYYYQLTVIIIYLKLNSFLYTSSLGLFIKTDIITYNLFSLFHKFMPVEYNKIKTSLLFMWKKIIIFHTI